MKILEGIIGLRNYLMAPSSPSGISTVYILGTTLLQQARELKASSDVPATAVVTFEPHPLTVLRPSKCRRE